MSASSGITISLRCLKLPVVGAYLSKVLMGVRFTGLTRNITYLNAKVLFIFLIHYH